MTTNTYEIEQFMLRTLDGNFWSVNHDGKIIHHCVPKDYKPTFKRYVVVEPDPTKEEISAFRIDWTQEHFRRIEVMRMNGLSWKKVSQRIGGSESATSDFYKKTLRQQNENLTADVIKRRMKIVKHMIENFISPRFVKMYMGYDEAFIQSVMRDME
jgi:hypothetical protein